MSVRRACPHGCGPLRWIEDQWHCPKCGDEWPARTDVELVIELDADEQCPLCGSIDLSLWAEDGESPRADLWECASCGVGGNVIQPPGAANEDACRVAFDGSPAFYAVRIMRHWNGWAVPAMTRRQIMQLNDWITSEGFEERLEWRGLDLVLIDVADAPHVIEAQPDGTWILDLGWALTEELEV